MKTTITFRTDLKLKNEAADIFNSLGLNLSSAINMFLKQTVINGTYPYKTFENDIEYADIKNTYPKNFFSLFGKGANLGLDNEPKDIPIGEQINL